MITTAEEYRTALMNLIPDQGCWTDGQYLILTNRGSRLVELTDGVVEFLPMPTHLHQMIVRFLFLALDATVTPLGGTVLFAPMRLRIRPGKFREPDLLLVKAAHDPRCGNRYWTGADLTLEVVSPEQPERDLVDKRRDYAEAKVQEYWIVNPLTASITVLRLENDAYVEHGVFTRGQRANSVILPGFGVNVDDVFNMESVPDTPEDENHVE